MANDAYLRFDGIKGESQDHGHKEWIEISGVRWAIQQPKSATASTAGGHTAERAELSEVSFEKLCDLSSPILMQTCAMGKTIPKATFEFMRADGDGNPIKYFEIELENVLIGTISPILGAGLLQESIGLKFSQVRWRYTQQRIAGSSAGNTAGGWNLAMNRPA
jgi:type VI secretion system secreted protein Hcp